MRLIITRRFPDLVIQESPTIFNASSMMNKQLKYMKNGLRIRIGIMFKPFQIVINITQKAKTKDNIQDLSHPHHKDNN